MSWNGSNNKVGASPAQGKASNAHGPRHTAPGARHGLVAGLVVVLGGAIAAWFMLSPSKTEEPQGTGHKAQIAEVGTRPRAVPSVATEDPASMEGSKPQTGSLGGQEIAKPTVDASHAFIQPKVEGRLVVWKRRDPPPVFTNRFEGYVADVLTMVPGERIMDTSLDESFDEDFAESLKSEIVINPDDPEDVAELKRAVIEAREEVKAKVRKGQKASEIIMTAMNEMNEIADYRDQLQSAFNEYLLMESDPRKIVEYEQAANAMLDEYGALHIEGPHDEATASEQSIEAKEEKIEEISRELEKEDKK